MAKAFCPMPRLCCSVRVPSEGEPHEFRRASRDLSRLPTDNTRPRENPFQEGSLREALRSLDHRKNRWRKRSLEPAAADSTLLAIPKEVSCHSPGCPG